MTSALIIKFVKDHWRELTAAMVIGALVVGVSLFYSSWKMRGAKVERLQVQLETALFQNQKDRAACAEIAATLARVNAANAEFIAESERIDAAKADELAQAKAEADRAAAVTASSIDKAVAAIARAETCEDKVAALARAAQEALP